MKIITTGLDRSIDSVCEKRLRKWGSGNEKLKDRISKMNKSFKLVLKYMHGVLLKAGVQAFLLLLAFGVKNPSVFIYPFLTHTACLFMHRFTPLINGYENILSL